VRLRTAGPASEVQIALFWAAWTAYAVGLARLGAGLPAAPAARAGDGFAVREAGHSRRGMEHHRRGWNRTVHVIRCSDRGRDHGSGQRFNVTVAGLARWGPACHLAGRRDSDSKPSHGSMVGLSFLFRELNVAGQGCRRRRDWIPPVGRARAGLLAGLRRAFCLYHGGVVEGEWGQEVQHRAGTAEPSADVLAGSAGRRSR
jgi:hypothetical protein